jgi:hypothetical protein
LECRSNADNSIQHPLTEPGGETQPGELNATPEHPSDRAGKPEESGEKKQWFIGD